ncbi:hypothetical protein [Mesorhizobium sp. M0203]|uniref:hypothetical protein n=1 Tax=Mesorhizobium sp. M0203 TaxID=2956912 RepID=UPI00333891F7
MQGRAQPRELSVYDDWSKLLGLEQPGAWIAESDLPAFTAAICARHGIGMAELERRAGGPPKTSAHENRSVGAALAGAYACYSQALSPYHHGQLIRGSLSIKSRAGGARPDRLLSRDIANRPTADQRAGLAGKTRPLCASEGDRRRRPLLLLPVPAVAAGNVLGGYMCGGAIIGPEPKPSLTRILIVRLHDPAPEAWGGYLSSDRSIAEDLAALGLIIERPEAVDRQLAQFLIGDRRDGGPSQIPPAEFHAILETFDRQWLRQPA